MKENKKEITIVIPVYNDVAGLKGTLNSLRDQEFPEEKYKIIVANDGGDKGVSSLCEEYSIQVEEIVPNRGSYHARNEVAETVLTPYLAFIDAGIVADKQWLGNGFHHLARYDYVAGDVKVIADHIPDIAAFHDYLTAFPMKTYFEKTGFGGAGNLFVRRSLFENIGYFDDRLRSCGDLEFGTRARAASGVKMYFAEDCLVYHAPRGHREKMSKLKRVKAGQRMLMDLYGDRFDFLKKKKGLVSRIKSFLPRPWSSVNEIYKKNERFSKIQLYIYMNKIKWIKTLHNL